MRQNLKILFSLLVFTGFLGSATAQNYVTIPDLNFLSALQEILPVEVFNEVGEMNADHEAVLNLLQLNVSARRIQSLEGIQYFSALQELDCESNQLIELPELPEDLVILYCGTNRLTILNDLPPFLEKLYCYSNQLIELPTLPQSLTVLYCSENKLANLSILPQALEDLDCSHNQLSELPELPRSLQKLVCLNNKLTKLPELPNSLLRLLCQNNYLTALPLLSPSLDLLQCNNNQISELPSLPQSLTRLICYNNQLIELPSLPPLLIQLFCRNNYLTQLPVLPDLLWQVSVEENCFSIMPERPEWVSASNFAVSPNREDCLVTGLTSESVNLAPGIYPNPVEEVLYLGAVYEDVRVYDLGGREMGSYSSTDHIRTDDWLSGVYLIRVGEQYVRVVKR